MSPYSGNSLSGFPGGLGGFFSLFSLGSSADCVGRYSFGTGGVCGSVPESLSDSFLTRAGFLCMVVNVANVKVYGQSAEVTRVLQRAFWREWWRRQPRWAVVGVWELGAVLRPELVKRFRAQLAGQPSFLRGWLSCSMRAQLAGGIQLPGKLKLTATAKWQYVPGHALSPPCPVLRRSQA